ncbi:hypothetical protein L917_11140 [Phytophthora nicotianae]|uniref:Uncharacterized protein n=1 Tax=Phytophthora nicotianae TaxID=4792 RepID=W2KY35_PHYNI|nr:hypothetical protein L917_11140 [Phytophthora nicotianae]
MDDKDVRCPLCYNDFKPLTCGFYKCVWKFEGVRSSDGFFVSSPWRDAGGNKYHRFDAKEDHGSVEWDSLLIIVKSRRDATVVKVPVSFTVHASGNGRSGARDLRRLGEEKLHECFFASEIPDIIQRSARMRHKTESNNGKYIDLNDEE